MILLDTSILIEILRKNKNIINKLDSLSMTPLATSEICIMELVYGIYSNKKFSNNEELIKRKLSDIEKLCNKFVILNFDRSCAVKTGEVMGKLKLAGNMIDFRDGMIACSALANGIKQIFTSNITHFEKITGLKVIS
jgi:predicted nucleic acid-binding protein